MSRFFRNALPAWTILAAATTAMAQSANPGPMPYLNPMGELLPWVFSPQMQKEIELLDDQRDRLAKLQAESVEKSRDLHTATHDEDRQEWMRKYNEVAGRLAQETDQKVRDILLPHQVRRLRQIVLQTRLHGVGYGSTAGLVSREVAEELGLTEAQKRELKAKEKELVAEIQRKTREFHEQLREESEEELLSVLTEAQRQKLNELVGEKFDWRQQAKPPVGGKSKPKDKDAKDARSQENEEAEKP